MKLNSTFLAVFVFILMFGGIGLSSAINLWETESNKVPAKYDEGTAAGEYNPADIRGSYTFGEVSTLFDIPLGDLQAAFQLPEDVDPSTYPLKSLEALFAGLPEEVGTGSVRMFVAFYKGLPYTLSTEEETYLFPEGAEVLRIRGQMTAEQVLYLEDHLVLTETPSTREEVVLDPETAVEKAPLSDEHAPEDRKITGKTTFQNLLDWGVGVERIEELLGGSIPSGKTVIKDYLSLEGIEFSTLKTEFQGEVDKSK